MGELTFLSAGSPQKLRESRFVISVALAVTLSAAPADALIDCSSNSVVPGPLPGTANDGLRGRFTELAKRWVEETTTASSDFRDIVMNDAYQQIIALGPAVVPLILQQLATAPDHWGWALHYLTGENPVPAEAAGDVQATAEAWIAWGRTGGRC